MIALHEIKRLGHQYGLELLKIDACIMQWSGRNLICLLHTMKFSIHLGYGAVMGPEIEDLN